MKKRQNKKMIKGVKMWIDNVFGKKKEMYHMKLDTNDEKEIKKFGKRLEKQFPNKDFIVTNDAVKSVSVEHKNYNMFVVWMLLVIFAMIIVSMIIVAIK